MKVMKYGEAVSFLDALLKERLKPLTMEELLQKKEEWQDRPHVLSILEEVIKEREG